ncbi:MAG: hypothetical protein AB7E51_13315 [Pseudodesulfovibrio sp.]|jgi:hypothetical protein|uniref:hypothetical protein n=1 Tax=Pseudodesulfovibrio sp. TaxID=2035812 RepID=UPI003D0BE5FA
MRFATDKAEYLLRKILPWFFLFIFLITIRGALRGYWEHNAWTIGDWLINYQGGMVRRGLLGEIIFQLSSYFSISPGRIVVVFQLFFYSLFFYYAYLLLNRQKSLLPYIFFIFAPAVFAFQILGEQGGYRKEIIYYALLGYLVWTASTKKEKTFVKIFYAVIILSPIAILTHEMLAIFVHYFVVFYVLSIKINAKKIILLCASLIPAFVSFFVAFHYSGSKDSVSQIFNSFAILNYPINDGAIAWLERDASFGYYRVVRAIQHSYLFYIPLSFIAFAALIPLRDRLRNAFSNKFALLLVLASILGTIRLCIIAVDWGRFIYINLILIFFSLCYYLLSRRKATGSLPGRLATKQFFCFLFIRCVGGYPTVAM